MGARSKDLFGHHDFESCGPARMPRTELNIDTSLSVMPSCPIVVPFLAATGRELGHIQAQQHLGVTWYLASAQCVEAYSKPEVASFCLWPKPWVILGQAMTRHAKRSHSNKGGVCSQEGGLKQDSNWTGIRTLIIQQV